MRFPDKGLTLLEVMITSAILLVAICGLLFTFISCIFMNESDNNLVVAAGDAQYVLEEVKALPYAEIAGYSAPEFNNLTGESVTLNKDIGAQIAEVTVNVNWTERQRNKALSLSTRIAK
ncbi:MAG: prepilin-type N-terminal cleavage/methylation domain-containing protein [Candidatus Omnitrophota bacterium]